MKVNRSNPVTNGMGCPCTDNPTGMQGLGMSSYSVASWNPPSQSSEGGYFGMGTSVNTQGTAANALANASPDAPNPTTQAVFDAFGNDVGSAQPGVLQLYPNATADNLTFVRPLELSTQCKVIGTLNSNPMWLIGGAFLLFYLTGQGTHKAREYHARRKAAKGAK